MAKRKRGVSKAKQHLGKRQHPSFWKKNKELIIVSVISGVISGLIVFMASKGIEAVGKLLLDNLF